MLLWKRRSLIIMNVQQLQRFVWRNLNTLDRSGNAASANSFGRLTLMEQTIATQTRFWTFVGALAIGENAAIARKEIRKPQMPCNPDGVRAMAVIK